MGGGGKLLGGTYLALFYLGILFAKHDIFGNMTLKKSIIMAGVSAVLWFIWWRFACFDRFALDAKLPFGDGFNPPGITSCLMAVTMLFLSCGVFSLLQYIGYLSSIVDFTSWIGKHTLYIFLYHQFFLGYVVEREFLVSHMWLKRVSYLGIMIFGSIALDYCFQWIKKVLWGKLE